jgi:general stress protein 26
MSDKQLTSSDIWDYIKSEHVCMMAESDGQTIRARPMAPIIRRDEHNIWFVTDRTSHKVHELSDDTPVTLMFQNSASNWYLSLIGNATVVDDRARVKELWSAMMKEWFDGPDDPRIVCICFEPLEADYWKGPNRFMSVLKMAATATTGARTDMGDAGKVQM